MQHAGILWIHIQIMHQTVLLNDSNNLVPNSILQSHDSTATFQTIQSQLLKLNTSANLSYTPLSYVHITHIREMSVNTLYHQDFQRLKQRQVKLNIPFRSAHSKGLNCILSSDSLCQFMFCGECVSMIDATLSNSYIFGWPTFCRPCQSATAGNCLICLYGLVALAVTCHCTWTRLVPLLGINEVICYNLERLICKRMYNYRKLVLIVGCKNSVNGQFMQSIFSSSTSGI